MSKCVYCHQRKGKRSCPALGGLICSICCGEHRGIAIRCPLDCIYFESNEVYQREKVGEQYEEVYQQVLDGLVRRSQKAAQKATMILNLVGWISYRQARKHPDTLDWEIRAGLEDVRQRLSPLAIPNKTGTPYGDVLWREMQEFLKTERLDQDTVAAGIDAARHLITTISGEALKTNRYLKGLIHYMESHYPGLKQQLAEEEGGSGLILPTMSGRQAGN
jgi:hypothetical protein